MFLILIYEWNILIVLNISYVLAEIMTEEASNNDHARQKMTRFHCSVPLCNGDSRYNPALSFHRFPKDATLRSPWITKVRRDEGPYFKVNMKMLNGLCFLQKENNSFGLFQITHSTRVCSNHFLDSDYHPPNNSGKTLLKAGVVPTVFDWSGKTRQRRKLIRQVDRYTDIYIHINTQQIN